MFSILEEPADLLKLAIFAFVGVYVINWGLRKMGLAAYTTSGS
jgi:hypothetical protein